MTNDDKALVERLEGWSRDAFAGRKLIGGCRDILCAMERIEALSAKLAEAEALLELQNQDIGRLRNNQDYGDMTKEDYEAIYGWGGQG